MAAKKPADSKSSSATKSASKSPSQAASKAASKTESKTASKAGSAAADLASRFEAAAARAQRLKERPDNETLLELYALYKQGTEGDVRGDRPGVFDFVGRAKYDAWARLKGTNRDAAMRDYIDLVDRLAS